MSFTALVTVNVVNSCVFCHLQNVAAWLRFKSHFGMLLVASHRYGELLRECTAGNVREDHVIKDYLQRIEKFLLLDDIQSVPSVTVRRSDRVISDGTTFRACHQWRYKVQSVTIASLA